MGKHAYQTVVSFTHAQKGKVKCETAVGTPDYISPEVSGEGFFECTFDLLRTAV